MADLKISDFLSTTDPDGLEVAGARAGANEKINLGASIDAKIAQIPVAEVTDTTRSVFPVVLVELAQSLGGGTQGAGKLCYVRTFQKLRWNRFLCFCAQGFGGSFGRLGVFEKALGTNQFDLINSSVLESFEQQGPKNPQADGLPAEGYFEYDAGLDLYFSIFANGDPQFDIYKGKNANAPYQWSHEVANVWNQPLPPGRDLPTTITAGSSDDDRYYVALYLDPTLLPGA